MCIFNSSYWIVKNISSEITYLWEDEHRRRGIYEKLFVIYRSAHQGSVMSFISGLEKASTTTLGKAFFKPFSKKYVF